MSLLFSTSPIHDPGLSDTELWILSVRNKPACRGKYAGYRCCLLVQGPLLRMPLVHFLNQAANLSMAASAYEDNIQVSSASLFEEMDLWGNLRQSKGDTGLRGEGSEVSDKREIILLENTPQTQQEMCLGASEETSSLGKPRPAIGLLARATKPQKLQ
ncbi:hypothetical protein NQZ68_014754 [Dissostichus eleginoides]|nr:hypothetical protein NQZ68_014754 [Dissostichus eleginoides]